MKTILVTGGLGFIGSNFIRYMLNKYPDYKIINIDLITYSGNPESLKDIETNPNYIFIREDISNFPKIKEIFEETKPNIVVNFAAESHNDRGVLDPSIFIKTNILGTQCLLEASRQIGVERFHHISTCEVFGDLELDSTETFNEKSAYKPRTPYNASKAGADHIVRAYFHTFKLPITISNCGNNYGPHQHVEKLIPLFTTNALEDKELPLFKSSQNKREWVHVLDHCKAIDLIIHKGNPGESYNIGTGIEKSVEEITNIILKVLNKPESLKKYVKDRPGHDKRYLLDSSKIREELGWKPEIDFEEGMKQTVEWYLKNKEWWEKVKSGEFQKYYQEYYNKLKDED